MGEPSPLDGTVVSPELGIYLLQTARDWETRKDAAVSAAERVLEAEIHLLKLTTAADLRVKDIELQALREARERSWLEHPVVVAIAAIAVTVAVYFVAVETIDVARD